MKTTLTLIYMGFLIMGLFSFLSGKSNNIQNTDNLNQIDDDENSRPEFSDGFTELSSLSYDYLIKQQELVEEKYSIDSYEKWYYDEETGILSFLDGDTIKIKIIYEMVGSISQISNTWLWSWANPNVSDEVKSKILAVKEFGNTNKFEPLTKRKWFADEVDAWELTAISAYLLNAKGAYRFPLDNTFSFVIYKEIIDLREE